MNEWFLILAALCMHRESCCYPCVYNSFCVCVCRRHTSLCITGSMCTACICGVECWAQSTPVRCSSPWSTPCARSSSAALSKFAVQDWFALFNAFSNIFRSSGWRTHKTGLEKCHVFNFTFQFLANRSTVCSLLQLFCRVLSVLWCFTAHHVSKGWLNLKSWILKSFHFCMK